MASSTISPDPAKLASQIRQDAPGFIDAAVEGFRELVAKEYVRLRGYAFESGERLIVLQAELEFVFDGESRGVTVRTMPRFNPSPLESVVKVAE